MRANRLLLGNALFLGGMGSLASVADLVGHFLGRGPFGKVMVGSPLAISSLESHLLAVILGVVLWRGAASAERGWVHGMAAVVHVVLGGCNLLYFESAFGALDLRMFGVVVTLFHVGFAVAEGVAAARFPRPLGTTLVQGH